MISCTLENGKQVKLRHITVDAVAVKDNQILLIKRSEESLEEPDKYALPGGYLDRDEDPKIAVERELKEETGYEAVRSTLFRIVTNPNRKGGDRQSVDFAFIVEVGEKVAEPDQEVSEVIWKDMEDLPEESDFAFDHFETIQLYLEYLKNKNPLPRVDF